MTDKYIDEQAIHIIQQGILEKQFVLVVGVHSYTTEALQDIGKDQRQRAFKHINAQRDNKPIGDDHKDGNIDKLFHNLAIGDKGDRCTNVPGPIVAWWVWGKLGCVRSRLFCVCARVIPRLFLDVCEGDHIFAIFGCVRG